MIGFWSFLIIYMFVFIEYLECVSVVLDVEDIMMNGNLYFDLN